MFQTDIRAAAAVADILGEGCLYDADRQRVLWVDIEGRLIRSLSTADGAVARVKLPERVGSLGLYPDGALLAALESGFASVSLAPFTLTRLPSPEIGRPRCRFNDGRSDPEGRFWAGTMDDAKTEPLGALWRRDPDGACHRLVGGVTIANGIAFSPDGRTLYFADSPARVIWAFARDPASGALGARRVFARTEPGQFPDGATVDAAGRLWIALWGAGRVRCYAADGGLVGDVALPVSQPSCCCFGGPDLATLYVTSARQGLGSARLQREPLAGALFAVTFQGAERPRGRPEPLLQPQK